MKMIKNLIPLIVFSMLLFAKENRYKVQEKIIIHTMTEERPVVFENSTDQIMQTREEIDLFVEDFESDAEGWNVGNGWQLSDQDSNSPTHSMNSPNDATTNDGLWNLLSPIYTLPALGGDETMNFDFYIKGDTPDTDGDGDDYLDDYYFVSILDLDALVWHASSTGSLDGNSYWCGQEELSSGVGGYLSEWLQFLDTPSFLVPNGGTLAADMKWALEPAAGAGVTGTCVNGWDSANVRISNDNGLTWNLLNSTAVPYDFDCGNGWIYHDLEYDTGGLLHHLAPGWGDERDWDNISFDISEYAGQEVIVRFAFGSDGGWCTLDDAAATGFQVDNIVVSGEFECSPEIDCAVVASGEVWVDQLYDYCDADRPGYQAWEHYGPGMPFNSNVFMDISDFAEKDVVFRFQTRYDDNNDGGTGMGIYIDDFRIYKVSGGNYPAPFGLMGEALNESVDLTWTDMNASGTSDFVFDNDGFSNEITMLDEGSTSYAGIEIPLAGGSTVNQVSVYSADTNGASVNTTIAAFAQFGSLYSNEPEYEMAVVLQPGWNNFTVNWDFTNSYIVGYQFTDVIAAALDESASPSVASQVLFEGSAWEDVTTALSGLGVDGEWGVRANISYAGAGVTYNVYVDGIQDLTGVSNNTATVSGLMNNVQYSFSVSATYSDGESSDQSDSIVLTPQAQTVHEESHDDGTAEEYYNAGSGNFTAVKYSAQSTGEDVVRYKWYQDGDAGAFYLKMYEDDGGMPGAETYSRVMAGGLFDGWNTYDLSAEGLSVSGDFWVGTKEFSSTKPFGLDTSSNSGDSYARVGNAGAWTSIDGNLMIRVYLDCGADCEGGGGSCTAGDVNSDGLINVLDIVAAVNFVLGAQSPDETQSCAADYNEDGIINVLDIVALVNLVLGG